jgi:hypothetical protein
MNFDTFPLDESSNKLSTRYHRYLRPGFGDGDNPK